MNNQKPKVEPWLIGTVAFIVLFLVGMIALVIFLFNQDVNMVTDRYYEKDLRYEDQMDRISRGQKLESPPELGYVSPGLIRLSFEPGALSANHSGELQIYRPADHNDDLFVALDLQGDTLQEIVFRDQPSGLWRWKLTWTNDQTEYYLENSFFVP